MALEISELHRGIPLGSFDKDQADPSSQGTIDPFQLMMKPDLNFAISHPSQRLARDETNDRHHRLSSPSGRMTRKEDTSKMRPESPNSRRHHQNECDRISKASLLQHPNSSSFSQAAPATTGAASCLNESERISPDISDSPLDFSTKRHKLERKPSASTTQDLESPCSRLRNILSMKSPGLAEDMTGTVLNLSKESGSNSPGSLQGWNSTPSHSSSANNSHCSSPITMDTQSFSPASSRPPSVRAPAAQHPVSTNPIHSMAFSHYGLFSPNMSPMISQVVPGSGLSLGFDQNPPMFHHVAATASAGSPTLPFGTTAPLLSQTNSSVSNGNGKPRVTRPFKAYPKDPMTFPGMGLYGLPLGTPPGTPETLIHQQSNHAYAEYRKQILNQSQGRSKRVGQKNCPTTGPLSDSTTSSTNPLNYGLGMIEPGATSSGAEEYLSTSDDGYCSLAKNRLIKSEDQMKDEAYWERRRKNNEAAKRSRDARRAKEDEIAIRASFLEQENLKLRFELCALKNETAKLRCLLYNKSQ